MLVKGGPAHQVHIKENIKAPHHWPFRAEFTDGFTSQRPVMQIKSPSNYDQEQRCIYNTIFIQYSIRVLDLFEFFLNVIFVSKWHSKGCFNIKMLYFQYRNSHYADVIMIEMASQITSLTVVYSIVNSGADQSKHQSSASLAFVRGIHRDRWIPRTKGQ